MYIFILCLESQLKLYNRNLDFKINYLVLRTVMSHELY